MSTVNASTSLSSHRMLIESFPKDIDSSPLLALAALACNPEVQKYLEDRFPAKSGASNSENDYNSHSSASTAIDHTEQPQVQYATPCLLPSFQFAIPHPLMRPPPSVGQYSQEHPFQARPVTMAPLAMPLAQYTSQSLTPSIMGASNSTLPSAFSSLDSNQCPTCRVMLPSYSLLKLHLNQEHPGERLYPCDLCDKKLLDPTTFRMHRKTHVGPHPFECTVCFKRFTLRGNLTKHMRVHSGERPFSCTICDKRFTQKAHVKRHQRTHEVKTQILE